MTVSLIKEKNKHFLKFIAESKLSNIFQSIFFWKMCSDHHIPILLFQVFILQSSENTPQFLLQPT